MAKIIQELLTTESIDSASEEVVSFLEGEHVKKEDVVRGRLFVEETLLQWFDNGISESFRIRMGTRFKKPYVCLEAEGRQFNLLEQEESVLLQNLLEYIGRKPACSYKDGCNTVLLEFPRANLSSIVKFLVTVFLALFSGLMCNLLLPEDICYALLTGFINPVYSAAFRVLGLISGPLILFTVIWGIYGIGDTVVLGDVGTKLISQYVIISFAVAFICMFSVPLLGIYFQIGATASSAFQDILEMILDIIPSNIIEPLSNGNTMQIIFLAIIIGTALLYLGKEASVLAKLTEQINGLVQFLMAFISSLMPGLIFIIIFRLVLSHMLSSLSSIWRLFALYLAECVVLCAVFTIITSIRFRISPLAIIRKSMPYFIVALMTSSSAASLPNALEASEKEFGIEKNFSSFGLPLGMVMFMPGGVLYLMLSTVFFANQFGVSISPAWLVSAAILAALLAIAAPPIPGAAVVIFTMLFSKLGIPTDALAIVFSVDVLFDFLATAANMYTLPLEMVHVAATKNRLDMDAFKK